MTNRKKTNKDIQNAPQKTKDQTTWTPVTGGEAIKIIGLWHKKIFIAKSVSRHLLFNMRNNRRHQWSRTAYPSDLHGYYNAFKWVRFEISLVLCVFFCGPRFVFPSFFLLAMVLTVLYDLLRFLITPLRSSNIIIPISSNYTINKR